MRDQTAGGTESFFIRPNHTFDASLPRRNQHKRTFNALRGGGMDKSFNIYYSLSSLDISLDISDGLKTNAAAPPSMQCLTKGFLTKIGV